MYAGNTLLGTSNLEVPVENGARVAGRFRPTAAFASVADVFELYGTALELGSAQLLMEYVTRRDRLRLEVWDTATQLDCRVDLISMWDATNHAIHVSSTDERLWRWRRLL